MEILVIPVDIYTKKNFFDLLKKEEDNRQLFWIIDIKHNLVPGCFVFFPEVNKTVRLYKIEKVHSKYIILSKAIADFYWKDWAYVSNSKNNFLPDDYYIIEKDKTLGIYNFFKTKIPH